jgi:DNA-binding NarL/FixJ family response regulator
MKGHVPNSLRAATAALITARAYSLRRTHLRGVPPAAPTDRENEVIDLVCEGHNNESIGHQLGIGVETVKRHLYNAFLKLNIYSRTELVIAVLNARHAEEIALVRRECDIFDLQSN